MSTLSFRCRSEGEKKGEGGGGLVWGLRDVARRRCHRIASLRLLFFPKAPVYLSISLGTKARVRHCCPVKNDAGTSKKKVTTTTAARVCSHGRGPLTHPPTLLPSLNKSRAVHVGWMDDGI